LEQLLMYCPSLGAVYALLKTNIAAAGVGRQPSVQAIYKKITCVYQQLGVPAVARLLLALLPTLLLLLLPLHCNLHCRCCCCAASQQSL
jgi:hypothetical protein